MTQPILPPPRRFLFLDPDLTSDPDDAAGKPDGYARMASDGSIFVVYGEAYEQVTFGVEHGGGGGGDSIPISGGIAGNVIFQPGAPIDPSGPGEVAIDQYYVDIDSPRLNRYQFLPGGPAGGSWMRSGQLLKSGGTYTVLYPVNLEASRAGLIHELTSVQNLTLQPGASTATNPATWQVDSCGASGVTITPGTGVTINGTNAVRTMTSGWSSVTIRKLGSGTDAYIMTGDFT